MAYKISVVEKETPPMDPPYPNQGVADMFSVPWVKKYLDFLLQSEEGIKFFAEKQNKKSQD